MKRVPLFWRWILLQGSPEPKMGERVPLSSQGRGVAAARTARAREARNGRRSMATSESKYLGVFHLSGSAQRDTAAYGYLTCWLSYRWPRLLHPCWIRSVAITGMSQTSSLWVNPCLLALGSRGAQVATGLGGWGVPPL